MDRFLYCHFADGRAESTPEVASFVLHRKLCVCGLVDIAGGVAFSLLLGVLFDEWPALLQVLLRHHEDKNSC